MGTTITMMNNAPLGVKLIWINQALGVSGLLLAAFDKPRAIIVGPWILPIVLSNIYLGVMLVSQGFIVFDLLKFKRSAWQLLIFVELVGLLYLAANVFISPAMLDHLNKTTALNISLNIYRLALLPAIILQLIILIYIFNKRHLFRN